MAVDALNVDHDMAREAFVEELDRLLEVASALDDRQLLGASRCRGWSVGDVLVHVHLGLQEMLLGIVDPTDEPADRDAATYWQADVPTNDADADDLDQMRFVRLVNAAYRRPRGMVRHLEPTARGVARAVGAMPRANLRFQGHVLTSGDFLTTWAVELAIHHLDLGLELDLAPPAPAAVRLARATVEALAGGPLPVTWPDDVAVLAAADRVRLDEQQLAQAGPIAARLPVL